MIYSFSHKLRGRTALGFSGIGGAAMTKKYGTHFSTYKCLFCDGYHIGKNRDNKVKTKNVDK